MCSKPRACNSSCFGNGSSIVRKSEIFKTHIIIKGSISWWMLCDWHPPMAFCSNTEYFRLLHNYWWNYWSHLWIEKRRQQRKGSFWQQNWVLKDGQFGKRSKKSPKSHWGDIYLRWVHSSHVHHISLWPSLAPYYASWKVTPPHMSQLTEIGSWSREGPAIGGSLIAARFSIQMKTFIILLGTCEIFQVARSGW